MNDSNEIGNSKANVLSVFHDVLTYIPGNGNVSGVLIVAKNDNELIFWWRDYPEPKSFLTADKNEKAKFSIILRTSNIQKVMINYQKDEPYLLFSTIQPANMHQFLFSPGTSTELISFAQLLSLFQCFKQSTDKGKVSENESNTLETAVNYIADSFTSTKSRYHLYEFNVENDQISIPIDFTTSGLLPQSVVYVKPDLHIISQFKIVAEDYTKNPITEKELDSFKSLNELKNAVMNRGLDPSIRSVVWPLIFGIIPFDKDKRESILKRRVEEYIKIRNQWLTMSKMQLKNYLPVREAFSTIRVDVKRTHLPESILQMDVDLDDQSDLNQVDDGYGSEYDNNNPGTEENSRQIIYWSRILTNILRTFTMWNLDVRYTQGLNDFVANFINIFCHMFKTDKIQAEALTFWCFASFVELNSSGLIAEDLMAKQSLELPKVFEIIEKFHPACAKWLRMNGVNDLSFLISSFILVYGRSFSQESVSRIWEALVCVEAPWLFLRYFSASLIILSFPSFQQIPNCSSGKLVSMLDRIFYNQEIGAVIGVSLKMMNASFSSNKDEIKSYRKKKIPISTLKSGGIVLFQPYVTYNIAYDSAGPLFE